LIARRIASRAFDVERQRSGGSTAARAARLETSGERMAGLRLLGGLCAAVALALVLDAAVCLLPTNEYQRWQLPGDYFDRRAPWIYERIHFDPRPVDVAIIGSSRAQLGFSAAAVEDRLAQHGKHANVVNFALPFQGDDLMAMIVDELYKTKSPKVIVLQVDERPTLDGHLALKIIAPEKWIAFPPTPLLHNYIYNLSSLPARQVRLFGANLFPNLFGLTKEFDPDAYARTRTDYTTTFTDYPSGKIIDMEDPVPRATLIAQVRPLSDYTFLVRAFDQINGGEDYLYIREIAREAKAKGTQLVFVFLPTFNGPQTISDVEFLRQYGPVLNCGDLAQNDQLYENWLHLNRAGAMIASARLADAIDGLDGSFRWPRAEATSAP
jgi:hypothetical protein